MENNTTDSCDGGDCDSCPTDPTLLIDSKQAIHALSGKWKLEILFTLMHGGVRFGALRRALVPVTQHMLTAQLRELERDGLISRKVLAEKPLQVAYELTDSAWGLTPAFRELLTWSKIHGRRRRTAASETTLGAELA
ncbi:transcriptional regulator [Bradyrhizobium sp. NAS96.2]|nr:transcriptional regulator [Bradyrhizobium sp. NAS96.2]